MECKRSGTSMKCPSLLWGLGVLGVLGVDSSVG